MMYNPCHPGEILREDYVKPLKFSITEFANLLGVSRNSLSSLMNEKSRITALMSLRLSKALNTTPWFWLTMQINYDLFHAKKNSSKAMRAVRSINWKSKKQKQST